MPGRSSLKFRLALAIGALAVVGASLTSHYASRLSRAQAERDQSALLQNIAVRMATQLAQDMSARANEIVFLAGQDQLRDVHLGSERKRAILERVREAYPFYAWIGIADIQGTIVVGTDGLLVGKSVAKRDWFQSGRNALWFGDAHDAFLLAKILPKPVWDDLPLRLVDVSAPIRDESGKVIGVLCGHLSLDWAFEARELMLDQLPRESLDLVVLNRDGKVLMGTPQLPSLQVDLAPLGVYQGLTQATRHVNVETWPDGQSYLAAAVRETPFRQYPGMGWAIVVRKSTASAFGPAEELSRNILLGGLSAATAFGALLWMLLKRYLRPLERLSEAAERIRDQDLAAPIPQPEGNDEVAVFGRSLTALVSSLQANNKELKLADRVFDESGQGILISDANNTVQRVNKSFTRITGYAPDEVVGKTPAVLRSGIHPPEYYQSMWNAIRTDGTWQGEIWNRAKDGKVYPEWLTVNVLRDESGNITNYIGILDDITEKKEYERRLLHLANYDQLTELPNRNLLQKRLEEMIAASVATEGSMALLFVDLDKFKHINDTLGHPTGDLVLKELAARFRSAIGESDVLARWGGDEFVVAMPKGDSLSAARLAKDLIRTLERPFLIDAGPYYLSMSVGIALCPTDGHSADNLLRCADTAMYRAKQDGASHYRFYEHGMNSSVERYLRVENAIRHAIDHDYAGFSLAFQPQFNKEGNLVVGAEVLLRLSHPDFGAIAPAEFIPIAEDSGHILPLGRWIISEALRSYNEVVQAGRKAVPLSINVSHRQLDDGDLVPTMQEACKRYSVHPSQVILEITESAIMRDEGKALSTLSTLRELGFKIAIDDFGTGYSCLNYLQKIRPAEIKIDQGFVARVLTDSDSRNIVKFTVSLASSLGMSAVAEGVETTEQFEALCRLGEMKFQGYLLGRPMPLDALVRMFS